MKYLSLLFFISAIILTACGAPITEQNPTETRQVEATEGLVTSSPTPTPNLPDTLTICTNKFPDSLFPYDGVINATKTNILALIQDNPFKTVNGELQPVILEKVPTQVDGDLRLEPITVLEGQVVVDAHGSLAILKPGVLVRSSGCRHSDCAITWDGESLLQMDQMVVEFKLREDLVWSDGIPVSAKDSVFSYRVADVPEASVSRWAADRTQDYAALDAQTIQWIGRPGFSTTQLEDFFWKPLPSHLIISPWSRSELLEDERLTTFPLSYGPFLLTSWEEMKMRFEPNPHYYLAKEGLPFLDTVVIILVEGGVQEAREAIRSGQCDLLDSTFSLENDRDLLAEIQEDEKYNVHAMMRYDWVQLVFGVQPASSQGYENEQAGLLGDPITRQAFAACLDRESMLASTTKGLGELWPSFLPPNLSQLSPDEQMIFDPQLGGEMLEQVGWQDHDGNAGTPRIAANVTSVPVGTELSLNLLISQSGLHQDLAAVIKQSLGECGIGVNVITMPASELYESGPDGHLFGRRFDLALISWQESPELDCRYYETSKIPDAEINWIGTNIAGLSDENYDQACSNAALALPSEYKEAVHHAERLYLRDLPSIPLFSMPGVLVISADSCFEGETITERDFFDFLVNYGAEDGCP